MNTKVHFDSNNFKSKLVPSQTLWADPPHWNNKSSYRNQSLTEIKAGKMAQCKFFFSFRAIVVLRSKLMLQELEVPPHEFLQAL